MVSLRWASLGRCAPGGDHTTYASVCVCEGGRGREWGEREGRERGERKRREGGGREGREGKISYVHLAAKCEGIA